MDTLWAPWRLTYIKKAGAGGDGCFLCDHLAAKRDRKHLILTRGKTCYVILNRYPYNVGHLLIAPRAHKADLSELTKGELLDLMLMTRRMTALLGRVLKAQGHNIGVNLGRVSGAGVPGHLHLHVVPRWSGDTNFMPVIGATKVMPEALDTLYGRLKAAL